jgi:RNA polymerase sigma factor for flagellar operon FliA
MIPRIDCDLEEAARMFALTRSPRTREQVCELALPLVRRLATGVLRRLPAHFTDDDLIGDGCVGLLRAIDRYDPERGMSFESWAARIVRGAMLNGLRRMDTVPERVRRDARNLDRARWKIAQADGSAPTDAAAAAGACLSRKKLHAVLLALRRAIPISLDAPIPQLYGNVVTLADKLQSDGADPAQAVSSRTVRAVVAQAVNKLGPRERMIIATFYTGETTFRAIGGRLGISKQRVSQIHGHALVSIRNILSRQLLDA